MNGRNFKKVLHILILLVMTISGCEEDDLQAPQLKGDFDPPRFNWTPRDIYYRGFAGMWAQDTNTIFLLNNFNKSLYIVTGNIVNIHFVGDDYYLSEIRGISNNEIYLFGTKWPERKLTIVKWNGASFEFYDTDIDSKEPETVRGCVVNSSEIWAGSQGGLVWFDGHNMISYAFHDTLLYLSDLFLSIENKVQYIIYNEINEWETQQSLFEFRDTGFVRIFNDIQNTNNGFLTFLIEISGYKMGLQRKFHPFNLCVENFTGSSFTPYFCYNKKILEEGISVSATTGTTGKGSQNFMQIVSSSAQNPAFFPYFVGIVHWNGNSVSAEMGVNFYVYPGPFNNYMLYCINENTYLLLSPYSEILQNNTLYIGTKK